MVIGGVIVTAVGISESFEEYTSNPFILDIGRLGVGILAGLSIPYVIRGVKELWTPKCPGCSIENRVDS